MKNLHAINAHLNIQASPLTTLPFFSQNTSGCIIARCFAFLRFDLFPELWHELLNLFLC